MPEGPFVILAKKAVDKFTDKKNIGISGNCTIDQSILQCKKIIGFKSWGRHFLICIQGLTLSIHFLMFGSYKIDEKKRNRAIRLRLTPKKGEINLHTCSIEYVGGGVNHHYDRCTDLKNEQWDIKSAKAKFKATLSKFICNTLP